MEESTPVSKPWHSWYVLGPSMCSSSPASEGGRKGRGKELRTHPLPALSHSPECMVADA